MINSSNLSYFDNTVIIQQNVYILPNIPQIAGEEKPDQMKPQQKPDQEHEKYLKVLLVHSTRKDGTAMGCCINAGIESPKRNKLGWT